MLVKKLVITTQEEPIKIKKAFLEDLFMHIRNYAKNLYNLI